MKLLTITIVLNAFVINTVLSSTCPTVKGGNIMGLMKLPKEFETFYKKKCSEISPPTQAHVTAALHCLQQHVTPCAEKHAKKLASAALSCLKSNAFAPDKICASQTMGAVSSCFEKNVLPKTSMDELMDLGGNNAGLIAHQAKLFKTCMGNIKK